MDQTEDSLAKKVQEIFAEALELDAEQRAIFLQAACGGNKKLQAEVESLFDSHDAAGGFMANPTAEFVEPAPKASSLPEEPGKVIDRYKLLEVIGEGGFGVVYMAQQSEPIRRRVALKIIKLGMDTSQVVARFEAERQALAMMDHPNIARVIDGGATDTGRPYFVMELVRGDPITEFFDRHRLATQQRLELFQQVCHAVQHAHQKGIIHRDIKPSNVLVTISDDRPLVKVIDFGIAKATNSELTEKTLFTEFRQLIGTPQYMSPEQAERSGVDVDTRSDIYSLGVLLYEVLTGCTPLDPKKLSSAAWHELQKVICEDEPTKPSAAVSMINADTTDAAKRRATEPSRLGGILRGDLDWIVLKSIEKDRSRRYATASQLADDIGRYLCDEAVEATPPSAAYRLSKFARRNKSLLAAVGAIGLALLLGLFATTVMATAAMRARQMAQRALLESQQARHEAEDAKSEAEVARRKAQRSAIVAGGSILIAIEDADELARGWRDDLAKQRDDSPADDEKLVREEAQFANWYGILLLRNNRKADALKLIDEYYDRVKRVLGQGDSNFLGLCNTLIQARMLNGSPAKEIAPLYKDLLPSMERIHGVASATVLLPEFAGFLAQAGQDQEAANAIKTYLARHREAGSPPLSEIEIAKLDVALDKLVDWRDRHAELYQQLRAFRETGVAAGGADDVNDDPELARDAEGLQGKWEQKRVVDGRKEHMVIELSGTRAITKFLDENGQVIPERGHSANFALSRSGAVKVFTSYLGSSPQNGVAFVYHLEGDRFSMVSGMLSNRGSLPETAMFIWKRVPVE